MQKMIGAVKDTSVVEEKKKRHQYREKLRDLSERVEQTRKEERLRIARAIHDELGQMLTILKMDVSLMKGTLSERLPGDVANFYAEKTTDISDQVDGIIESVQRIISELRPEILEELGLIEALQWQASELAKRTGLTINFNTTLKNTDFLEDEIVTTIYRIFQEIMHNIIRHANASSVDIALREMYGDLLLSVADDGIGITRKHERTRSSYGITGMRERARFLDGNVYIEGKENKGTCVTVRIPLGRKN